jgi:predicted transcriptional regulator
MPPVACASDDALHVAKLAVNSPLPRAVYVVDENGRLLGTITDAHLAREVFQRLDPNLAFDADRPRSVAPVLQPAEEASLLRADSLAELGVRSLRDQDTLSQAMRVMYRSSMDELPVVNADGKLVGVVRALDILREWLEDILLVRLGDETESFY